MRSRWVCSAAPTPPLLVALPAIGVDAAHVLDSVELGSTLDVQATGRPDEFVVTHRLDSATFGPLMPSAPRVTSRSRRSRFPP